MPDVGNVDWDGKERGWLGLRLCRAEKTAGYSGW